MPLSALTEWVGRQEDISPVNDSALTSSDILLCGAWPDLDWLQKSWMLKPKGLNRLIHSPLQK